MTSPATTMIESYNGNLIIPAPDDDLRPEAMATPFPSCLDGLQTKSSSVALDA